MSFLHFHKEERKMYKIAIFSFGLLAMASSFEANATLYGSDPIARAAASATNGTLLVNTSDIVGAGESGIVRRLDVFAESLGTSYALIFDSAGTTITGYYAMTFTSLGLNSFINPTFTGSSIAAIGSTFGLLMPTTTGGAISVDVDPAGSAPYDIWSRFTGTFATPPAGAQTPQVLAQPNRNYSFQVTVPEPPAFLLVGIALAGWAARRKKHAAVTA